MKKLNEHTRKFVEVKEVTEIYRTSDNCLYNVYKDSDDKYFMDAYDAAPSVIELPRTIASDEDAIRLAQELIDLCAKGD